MTAKTAYARVGKTVSAVRFGATASRIIGECVRVFRQSDGVLVAEVRVTVGKHNGAIVAVDATTMRAPRKRNYGYTAFAHKGEVSIIG